MLVEYISFTYTYYVNLCQLCALLPAINRVTAADSLSPITVCDIDVLTTILHYVVHLCDYIADISYVRYRELCSGAPSAIVEAGAI